MKPWIPYLAIFAMGASLAVAQNGKGKSKDTGPLPLQGKELPNVSALTESGEEFPLRQKLKGRHGVIVFGCLT